MPSTVVRTFRYDAEARRLSVTLTSGRRYAYHDVPPEVAADFRAAFAKGVFFNRAIRNRYRFTAEAPEAPS
jgi:YD repeat-containing protein